MKEHYQPLRLLAWISLSVFFSELFVMHIIPSFNVKNEYEMMFLDSALLIFVMSPVLYFLMFRTAVDDYSEWRIAAKLFENTHDAILISDTNNRILMVNDVFCQVTGYMRDEVVGKTPRILSSGMHTDTFYQYMWGSLMDKGFWQGEIWNRRKNGKEYLEFLSITTVLNNAGGYDYFIAQFTDITERRNTENQIHYLSNYDELTNLPNRSFLYERASDLLWIAHNNKYEVGFLFADIDNFKYINDSLGHSVGDRLLQLLAKRLEKCLRHEDTLARVGGDEFVIIMPDVNGGDYVISEARKIQVVANEPFIIDDNILSVTLSIGVSIFPEHGHDFEALAKSADTAMNRVKQDGRNNIRIYTSNMSKSMADRINLENELHLAIKNNDLSLHYQPIIKPTTGQLVSVEALTRWHHSEMGWIPPSKFIPVAEESGLINIIGNWVLDTACNQTRTWQLSGMPAFPVAVNLSAAQFHHSDFFKKIIEVADKYELAHQYLALELTESMVMQDIEGAMSSLKSLSNAGFPLFIDDFGTGYSSLAYLKRFPIQKLKIDSSFVSGLPSGIDDVAIVRSIVSLARALNFEVIAEGVETKAQLDCLIGLGCDQIQGYFFSKPLRANELERFVLSNKIGKSIFYNDVVDAKIVKNT